MHTNPVCSLRQSWRCSCSGAVGGRAAGAAGPPAAAEPGAQQPAYRAEPLPATGRCDGCEALAGVSRLSVMTATGGQAAVYWLRASQLYRAIMLALLTSGSHQSAACTKQCQRWQAVLGSRAMRPRTATEDAALRAWCVHVPKLSWLRFWCLLCSVHRRGGGSGVGPAPRPLPVAGRVCAARPCLRRRVAGRSAGTGISSGRRLRGAPGAEQPRHLAGV